MLNAVSPDQVEFLFFCSGISCFIVAASAYVLWRLKAIVPTWGLVATAALGQGAHEWLHLLNAAYAGSWWMRIGLLASALACVGASLEFARQSLCRLAGRAPGRWVHLFLLFGIALGAIDGSRGLLAFAHLAMGLAYLAAAAILVLVFRRAQRGRMSLFGCAVCLAVFAAASIALTPAAEVPPASFINEKSLPTSVAFLFSLLRGTIALCGAVSMSIFCVANSHSVAAGRVFRRRCLVGGAAIVVAVLAMSWTSTGRAGRARDAEMRDHLLQLARCGAATIDRESISLLTGTPADAGSAMHRRLKDQLARLRKVRGARFAYLCGRRGEDVFFYVDSEPEGSEDYSPPGSVYQEASTALRGAFEGGDGLVEGPLPDEWGTWVSGLVPVSDGDSEVKAVLGIDIDASSWDAEVARARLLPQGLICLFFLLLVSGFLHQYQFRAAAARISASEARYREVFNSTRAVKLLVDPAAGRIVEANDAACGFYGHTRAQLLSLPVWRLGGADRIEWDAALRRMARGNTQSIQSKHHLADGSLRDVEIYGSAVPSGEQVLLHLIIFDITDRVTMEQELRKAASVDKLTGLPNRAEIHERIAQALARASQEEEYFFAVLFLDFDRFKLVNDSLGHPAGDQLLVQIAERLRAEVRDADSVGHARSRHVAGRLGGDEFIVLLDGLRNPDHAEVIADRILRSLSRPFKVQGRELFSTASIGIVTSETSADTPAAVISAADTAMYEAKLAGKARYARFNASMRSRAQARLTIETDLRRAIDEGQFFLLYQPIVNIESGELAGFEALARWKHPTRGIVSPAEFVPVAEECGLIVPIGDWVMREACRQLVEWRRSGSGRRSPVVSINISRGQFSQADFVERVGAIIQESGLEPSAVHLEITESTVMRDMGLAMGVLRRLRAIGVGLAMDDFGTGYSSLACLHQFPLSTLKIDRSFITHIETNRDMAALVTAIITLARNLNINVVAEGVETEDELSMLRALDCHFAQGYYLGKPMSAGEAGAMANAPSLSISKGKRVA